MIALVDDLPLVEFPEGFVFAFRQDWLRGNLLKAATQAGYPNWWLADHVTESVTCYLLSQFAAPVMLVTRLEETVQGVLRAIGYAEISDHFSAMRPILERSLLQVARLSEGCELAFFQEVRTLIIQELKGGAKVLHLTELTSAAKWLTGNKYLTSECSLMRSEIANYVCQCACHYAGDQSISIILK